MKSSKIDRKENLRARMLEKRKTLLCEERQHASEKTLEIFLQTPLFQENKNYNVIAGYLSILGELDILPILKVLEKRDKILSLPVTDGKSIQGFASWHTQKPLEKSLFGTCEPLKPHLFLEPDLIFVPLLAIDKNGFRLGYGKGFYDRWFMKRRTLKPIISIGCAYSFQYVDNTFPQLHDQRVDFILTPEKFFPTP